MVGLVCRQLHQYQFAGAIVCTQVLGSGLQLVGKRYIVPDCAACFKVEPAPQKHTPSLVAMGFVSCLAFGTCLVVMTVRCCCVTQLSCCSWGGCFCSFFCANVSCPSNQPRVGYWLALKAAKLIHTLPATSFSIVHALSALSGQESNPRGIHFVTTT